MADAFESESRASSAGESMRVRIDSHRPTRCAVERRARGVEGAISSDPRIRGFTLLEVMMSVGILALVLTSSLLATAALSQQSRLAAEVDLVAAESSKIVERVQSVPFYTVGTLFPADTPLEIPALKNGVATFAHDNPDTATTLVTITVAWEDLSGDTSSRNFTVVKIK
jgi:type II secretory pathway pseudopilin PulG